MSSQRVDEVTKLFRCVLTEVLIGITERFEVWNEDIEAALVLGYQRHWANQKNGQNEAEN